MIVRLKKEWFNPLYFHLLHYIEVPTIRKIKVFGGKSAAKTFSISQLFVIKGYTESCSTIAYRKEQTTIKTTIKQALKKAIESIYFEAVYDEMDFKFKGEHGDVILKGLDDEGKVKGLEGYKYVLFDELDHFEEEEWNQANLTLRGIENQKLFATWNPVSDDSWIKKAIDREEWVDLPKIVDGNPYSQLHEDSFVRLSKDGATLLIKTTYHDNKWVTGGNGYGYRDENLIREYEKLRLFNSNSYDINVLGKWGKIVTGMEFYHAFNRSKHVGKFPMVTGQPVHLTFDFNVVPYMTMICFQILIEQNVTRFRFFREYCKPNPDNSSRAICQYFVRDFSAHKPTVFYYGDASGKHRIAGQGNKRNFDDIEAVLLPFLNSASDRVLKRNPNPFKARDFINLILGGYWKDIVIEIDESCVELIKDAENVKVGIEGKVKERVNDKTTGTSYEKYGHTSDAAFSYGVVGALFDLYNSTSAIG